MPRLRRNGLAQHTHNIAGHFCLLLPPSDHFAKRLTGCIPPSKRDNFKGHYVSRRFGGPLVRIPLAPPSTSHVPSLPRSTCTTSALFWRPHDKGVLSSTPPVGSVSVRGGVDRTLFIAVEDLDAFELAHDVTQDADGNLGVVQRVATDQRSAWALVDVYLQGPWRPAAKVQPEKVRWCLRSFFIAQS